MLCTPANKEVIFPTPTPPPNGPPPASPHYTCYPILGTAPPPTIVSLETQFGQQPNDFVGQPRYLCTPTIKTVNSVSYGSLQEPHLKCYDITPPHNPPHIVNLKTQFGVENNVPVEDSKLVCIPVNKRPAECNGLIALSKVSWSAVAVTFTGATYNVYKGPLTSLSGSMTTGYGNCMPGGSGLSGPTYNDPATPAPGNGFFYLIDAGIPSHDGPVEGTIGYAQLGSNETERPNVNSCSP
jgi:hypothetical protein